MTDDRFQFAAFLATLAAIVLLSKIGGTGSDLAIMTGLIGVLGGLVSTRPAPPSGKVEITNTKDDPVPTIEDKKKGDRS